MVVRRVISVQECVVVFFTILQSKSVAIKYAIGFLSQALSDGIVYQIADEITDVGFHDTVSLRPI